MTLLLKAFLSGIIIVFVSELAKRNTFLGALVLSLPTISLVALTLIYTETKNVERIASMSVETFWLVIPSLLFFLLLPICLKAHYSYWSSLAISSVGTIGAYYGMTMLIKALNR